MLGMRGTQLMRVTVRMVLYLPEGSGPHISVIVSTIPPYVGVIDSTSPPVLTPRYRISLVSKRKSRPCKCLHHVCSEPPVRATVIWVAVVRLPTVECRLHACGSSGRAGGCCASLKRALTSVAGKPDARFRAGNRIRSIGTEAERAKTKRNASAPSAAPHRAYSLTCSTSTNQYDDSIKAVESRPAWLKRFKWRCALIRTAINQVACKYTWSL